MAEHKPTTEEVLPWDCVDGLCEHSTAGLDNCPPVTLTVCDTCRNNYDGDLDTVVPWPCQFAPASPTEGNDR